MSTDVMGQDISMPVIISPTGVQAVHPDGEVAVARAAAARGMAIGLSSFASKPIEEVIAANPQTFFQMYWAGDRDTMVRPHGPRPRRRRRRPDPHPRLVVRPQPRLGQPEDPRQDRRQDDGQVRARGGPPAAVAARLGQDPSLPDLSVPNLVGRGETPPDFFDAYGEWMQTPPPTWDDVAWLREQWGGPFMVKGIGARRRSAAAPSTPASRRSRSPTTAATTSTARRRRSGCCPRSPTAVGDEVEVVMDGGIRRGSDVVKALALGRQGGDDRARLPLGPGRQRPGRRRERARHPAHGHRLDAARPRALRHRRAHPRRRPRAGRLHRVLGQPPA